MLSVTDDEPPRPPERLNFASYVLGAGPPDKIAVAVLGPSRAERWSFEALRRAVSGTASGLLAAGLVPGERVLIRLANTVDFPIAHLGAAWAGLVPVPTAPGLTQPEVDALASELGPAVTLAADGLTCPSGTPVIGLDALRAFRGLAGVPPADTRAGEPAYIVYTSGTSGRPRGVVHAHRAVWARRMMHAGWYGIGPSDRLLHAGAFNWTYTLGTGVLDPLSVGATALIPAKGTEAAQLPLLMRRHGATIFAAAPGIYRRLLRGRASLQLPELRHGLSAGEKMPDGLAEAWRAATGRGVHEAYGMTECSTFVSGSPGRPAPAGTTGYAQPGRRIALLGPDGPVPRGAAGTIAVHRSDPGLMLGYWDAPAETEARFEGDWFVTGDVAVMAEDGAITYLGRDDDMINAGGIRISPLEIERAFEGIATACAATERAVGDGVSVIALAYEGEADEAALRARAEASLAPHKRPRIYERREIPRSGNGKLNRRALRSAP